MRPLLLLLLIPISVFVQGQQINGLAKDESGAPVNGATVSLVRAADSSTIKLAVTKPNGSFDFSGVKEEGAEQPGRKPADPVDLAERKFGRGVGLREKRARRSRNRDSATSGSSVET